MSGPFRHTRPLLSEGHSRGDPVAETGFLEPLLFSPRVSFLIFPAAGIFYFWNHPVYVLDKISGQVRSSPWPPEELYGEATSPGGAEAR